MHNKVKALVLSSAIALTGLSALSSPACAEWVKSGSSYSYKDDATGEKLTGWQEIDGNKYYFGKDGKALTGWKKIKGERYYFSPSKKGRMLTLWQKIGNKRYYFGADGIMRTGWVTIDGRTYYFGDDGVMRTGTVKADGKTYKFAGDGVLIGNGDNIIWDIPFGASRDDIRKTLKEDDILIDKNNMLYYKCEDKIAVCTFDADDKLCIFSYILFGDNVSLVSKNLEKCGYKLASTSKSDEQYGYAYANEDSVITVLCNKDEDSNTVLSYYSPEISRKMLDVGVENFDYHDESYFPQV